MANLWHNQKRLCLIFCVIFTGDFIIANKQIPGPRVYQNIRQFRGVDGKIKTKRFKEINKVGRNDILVFNFPYTGGWNKIDMDLNVYNPIEYETDKRFLYAMVRFILII